MLFLHCIYCDAHACRVQSDNMQAKYLHFIKFENEMWLGLAPRVGPPMKNLYHFQRCRRYRYPIQAFLSPRVGLAAGSDAIPDTAGGELGHGTAKPDGVIKPQCDWNQPVTTPRSCPYDSLSVDQQRLLTSCKWNSRISLVEPSVQKMQSRCWSVEPPQRSHRLFLFGCCKH
jgi:hypothetical protein